MIKVPVTNAQNSSVMWIYVKDDEKKGKNMILYSREKNM